MSDGRTRSRTRAWKAGLGIVALLAMAGAVPAAAQSPDASAGAGTTVTKMAYISPEAATDKGWNEQGALGAQTAADGIGAELIMADNSGYDDPAPILGNLKEDGA